MITTRGLGPALALATFGFGIQAYVGIPPQPSMPWASEGVVFVFALPPALMPGRAGEEDVAASVGPEPIAARDEPIAVTASRELVVLARTALPPVERIVAVKVAAAGRTITA